MSDDFFCPCGKPSDAHPDDRDARWWIDHVDDADFDLALGTPIGPDFERMATTVECVAYGLDPGTVIGVHIDIYEERDR